MINLDKCNGSCNVLSRKIYVPKGRKDNEANTMIKHISCDCKCKCNSTTCNSSKKWNNKTCRCQCKNYCTCNKDYSYNPRMDHL